MSDVVDCKIALADARASGSLACLKDAVALCKSNHFSGPEFQKAKTECIKSTAREELFSALEGQSYRLIEKKLKRAQHWLSKKEIQVARETANKLRAGRKLDEVKNSASPGRIRHAVERALAHGMDISDVAAVEHKANQLEVLQKLSSAKLDGAQEDILRLYNEASNLGVRHLDIKAACELSRITQDGEDPNALKRACAHATKVKVAEPLITSAQKLLRQQEANDELRRVLDSDDVKQIEAACDRAVLDGASASVVEAARKRLELLAIPVGEPVAVHTHVQTVFQIGQTAVHNKLGPLLAKVLASHATSEVDLHDGEQMLAKALDKLLSHRYSRFYSLGGAAEYPPKGGRPYFKPKGWVRYSLNIDNFEEVKDWCVAYHGTMKMNTIKIMLHGLCQPGDDGVEVAHGQAGSSTGKSIYVSPSIEYAGHPVYSEFFKLADDHWAQLVFQCRVKPGSFTERAGTLGNKHWRRDLVFDPNFPNWEGLEWLLENPEDVRTTGLLLREFGPGVDESTYGRLNTLVRHELVEWTHLFTGERLFAEGPQYSWTSLRQKAFAEQGFFVKE